MHLKSFNIKKCNFTYKSITYYNLPMPNLHSTVNSLGKKLTQIINFSGGNKKTFSGILTDSIKQVEFTKMTLKDGRMLMINTGNVDCIEVFDESVDRQMKG
jgi:signal transduction histidine kinase